MSRDQFANTDNTKIWRSLPKEKAVSRLPTLRRCCCVPLVSSAWMQPVLEVILRRSALHNPVVHLLFGSIPNVRPVAELRLNESLFQHKPKLSDQTLQLMRDLAGDTPATTVGTNYLFLWPTISPRNVRRSTRVRFFSIAGVRSRMCGISQRYSAMNQIGFSVVIQCR